jgi:hypothetical protein
MTNYSISGIGSNVTGYSDLLSGHVVGGVFNSWNYFLGGYFLLLIYVAVQLIVYFKSKSAVPGLIISILFLIISAFDTTLISRTQVYIVVFIAVAQLAGCLYSWLK